MFGIMTCLCPFAVAFDLKLESWGHLDVLKSHPEVNVFWHLFMIFFKYLIGKPFLFSFLQIDQKHQMSMYTDAQSVVQGESSAHCPKVTDPSQGH